MMVPCKKIIKLILIGSAIYPLYSFSASDGVNEQQSALDSSLKQEAAVCAQGDTPGTVGYAIKQAIAAHTELASATPDVESLFAVDNDCFSGITNMYDLSFAIPSLGSIMSSAENAVQKYAAKKVCSAVDKVSGLVTTPINGAIDNIKKYDSIDSAVSGGMDKLDPSLGSAYHGSTSSNYNVNVNPFNTLNNTVESSSSTASISVPQTTTSSSSTIEKAAASDSKETGYMEQVGSLFSN